MDCQALQCTLAGTRGTSTSFKSCTFHQRYELLEEIGRGAYGTVWKCCRRNDDLRRPYGVKIINKRRAGAKGLKGLMGEVETMSLLNHPNIVRLEETFQDEENLWIVMEYMSGGELRGVLRREGSFSEDQTRRIITQLLLALEFIHQRGFVHRDLKPENCLLSEGDLVCKISDFGFSVLVGSDQCLMSFCGTTFFMAPEIFGDTSYGKPVDMWAIGVMVYLMFTGEYPFTGSTQKEITDAICGGRYNLKTGKIAESSAALRDFISNLLEVDPTRRFSAREALKHPWIKLGLNMENPEAVQERMKNHGLRPRGVIRSVVIAVMAAHRLRYLRRCHLLDTSGCGGFLLLRNFRYAVSGVYEPPRPLLDCSGMFAKNPLALTFLLPMVEASRTIEALDLSNNNIEAFSIFQQLMRTLGQHPSLMSLNLSSNPIPALAGRSLLRLARSPQSKLLHLGLEGTHVTHDTLTQIAAALKEKAVLPTTTSFSSRLGSTTRSLESPTVPHPPTSRSFKSTSRAGVRDFSSRPRSSRATTSRLPPISPLKHHSMKN